MELDGVQCVVTPLELFRDMHMKHIIEGYRKAMKKIPDSLPITISFPLTTIVFGPLFQGRGIPHQFTTTDITVVNAIIPEYVFS